MASGGRRFGGRSAAEVEVLVAGGGVGGTMLARELSRAGHEVLLLEKKPRAAVGHDWFDTVDAEVFDEVGLARPRMPERAAGGFEFQVLGLDGRAHVASVMPPNALNVDRKLLAKRLLDEAEAAGATIRDRATVQGALVEDGRVVGLRARGSGSIRARLVVDATGVDGVLRAGMPDGLGFDRHLRDGEVFRTYRELRRDLAPGRRSIVLIGVEGGAQWLSRQPDGLVDLFAGSPDEPGRGAPRKLLAELIRREGGVGQEVVRGGQGARIPIRRSFDSFVAPGFLLVGDSACMANPLNGSGVGSALRAAHLAAEVADRALRRGTIDVATLWPYNVTYQRSQGAAFAKLHMLQQVLLREDVTAVDALLRRRLLPADSLWNMDRQFTLARLPRLVPGALTLPHHPGFLLRLGGAAGLMLALERSYRSYPERWDPRRFAAWQKHNRFLFAALDRLLSLTGRPGAGARAA